MKDAQREAPIIVVVKRVTAHGHHGGAWKVAFADFMTALMAMFLVLWIVGQSTDIKSAIAGHFQDPAGRADEFGSSIMPGSGAARPPLTRPLTLQEITDIRIDRLGRMANRLTEQMAAIPELKAVADQVEITMVKDGLRIELVEADDGQFFQSASPDLHPNGRAVLMTLAAELAVLPNTVIIEGHTDAQAFSGRQYGNWELSTDRAHTARRVLVEGGFPPDQIVQVTGYADRDPRNPSDPLAPENRRITITMQLGSDAGMMLQDAGYARDSTGESPPAPPGGGPPGGGGGV